ncbi:helix-turn-helix domain-containing protein [Streptomyces sp. NRRL B-1347]|uniref:MmyB family transcriptional regulator n=1 Tax=Streptomyces sp. NRRL B-1347 TaxID=1476877 RepID=UPI0004C85B8B|nr:helix-turn-helix domain-containing protein [Streptomyces sp. NRRL B-1347]
MNKTALRALLRERRALIAPESHGFVRSTGQGRRAPGLSQHQVDQLLHRTLGTYHRLESGNYPNPPTALLRDVARLFGLNEQEWVSLCRYALLQDPPGPLHLSSGKEVPGVWREAVNGISHIAYIADASWDMLVYNDACAAVFPGGEVPPNIMRWMVLSPAAREILLDWDTAWAPMLLPQLRGALATRPEDETLQQIEKEVLADPTAAPLYGADKPFPHPDGDERPLLHAELGPGWVTMCAAQPLTAPGARMMILVFHPGRERVHPRAPMLRAT